MERTNVLLPPLNKCVESLPSYSLMGDGNEPLPDIPKEVSHTGMILKVRTDRVLNIFPATVLNQ